MQSGREENATGLLLLCLPVSHNMEEPPPPGGSFIPATKKGGYSGVPPGKRLSNHQFLD